MSDEQKTWLQRWGPHLMGLAAVLTAGATWAGSCQWLQPDKVAVLFGAVKEAEEAKTAEANAILQDIQLSLAKLEGRVESLEKRLAAGEDRLVRVAARSARPRRPISASGGAAAASAPSRPPTAASGSPGPRIEASDASPAPPPGCESNQDCSEGQVCIDGRCIKVKTIQSKLPETLEQVVREAK